MSLIGQGIPAELFRQHDFPVIHIGFLENKRTMVSVDGKGFINLWKYQQNSLNSFHFFKVRVTEVFRSRKFPIDNNTGNICFLFKASKKYRVDFNKTMYSPLQTSKADVKFSEKSANRDEVAKKREQAETTFARLKLSDPWHRYVQVPFRNALSWKV